MLLVLIAEQSGRSQGDELWFSPEVATNRYSLSHDTRSAGLQELRRAGLVTALRRPVASDVFDVQRFRNVYILDLEHLNDPAEVPDKESAPPTVKRLRRKKARRPAPSAD